MITNGQISLLDVIELHENRTKEPAKEQIDFESEFTSASTPSTQNVLFRTSNMNIVAVVSSSLDCGDLGDVLDVDC
ncbi:hypothetical protein BLNAU_15726 [Blattamonas nauphoetae]|uniref:Uncharacterized protein n=1 Tax=Blattamonas nauphoetae TaxID=2049346 RepID=A0ABQ9XGE7_9EUKA|nr:hypothetical protein BLNAU_15726 [Blattamonas nauphoetae]